MSYVYPKVKVKVGPRRDLAQKVINFNADPKRRAAASRILNRDAREIVQIAKKIAAAEFKVRSEGRRPRPGTPHYVDSFRIKPATVDSLSKTTVQFYNTHPMARLIEEGSPEHEIGEKQFSSGTGPSMGVEGTWMRFPYKKDASTTRKGGPPGSWPTEFNEGGLEFRRTGIVHHPGQTGFHIMRRAVKAYHRANRGGT